MRQVLRRHEGRLRRGRLQVVERPARAAPAAREERNNALADAYRALAAKETDVLFGGRLAEYKYYDMAPVVEKVMRFNF